MSEFDKNHSKNADDAQETSPFPAFKDSQHKISSSDTLSERKISQDVTGAQIDSYKGITMDLKNEDSNKAGVYNDEPDLPLPAIIVPTAANVGICAGESQPSETYSPAMKVVKTPIVTMTTSNADEEENRENLTHFKSWGAPLVRNKPGEFSLNQSLTGTKFTDAVQQLLVFGKSFYLDFRQIQILLWFSLSFQVALSTITHWELPEPLLMSPSPAAKRAISFTISIRTVLPSNTEVGAMWCSLRRVKRWTS